MIDADRKLDSYPPTMGEMARLVLELKKAGEPITLSINGRGKLAIADDLSIQQLFEFVDQIETVEVLKERIARLERGEKGLSLEQIEAALSIGSMAKSLRLG